MKSAGRLPFYLDDRRHTPANQRHRSTAYAHRRYVYLKNGPNRRTTRMIRVPPSGPGGDDEPHSNGGFRPSVRPITLPSSLYAPAFDAGGIVGGGCSFAAAGAGFASPSASIRPSQQGRWGIIHRFLDRWPI